MAYMLPDDHLGIYILNVGQGDGIVIDFPRGDDDMRRYAVVDCNKLTKVRGVLDKLQKDETGKERLHFVCATHPHYDHIRGIKSLLEHPDYKPHEFWDSGFRHASNTYRNIITTIAGDPAIDMVRVTSGMEWYFGNVRISALAPSVTLRNRYATYGVDVNNASIVLRIEHHPEGALTMQSREYGKDVRTSEEAIREAGKSVVILAGDAEFDSWTRITEEYPKLERTSEHNPLVTKMINYLACSVIKVAHHGSMHSTSLDVYEKMVLPTMAVVSCRKDISTKDIPRMTLTRNLFPHPSTITALQEAGTRILTTDGTYEGSTGDDGSTVDEPNKGEGSVFIAIPPGGTPKYYKTRDKSDQIVLPPDFAAFCPLRS